MASWEEFGRFFGYPECCIEAFVSFESVGVTRKLDGTGYKPCQACNQLPEAVLIERINQNRICPIPFPTESRK